MQREEERFCELPKTEFSGLNFPAFVFRLNVLYANTSGEIYVRNRFINISSLTNLCLTRLKIKAVKNRNSKKIFATPNFLKVKERFLEVIAYIDIFPN